MRGQLSDQDLTNYALNDGLDARERLYTESMLAVSEECRNDIYEMIEMAQMLEVGFERENVAACERLTTEQRARLLRPQRQRATLAFLHKAAASVAIAACLAFAIVHPQMWHAQEHAARISQVGDQMSKLVTASVTPADTADFSAAIETWWETVSEDSSVWLKTASDALPQPAMICTPPSWMEGSTEFAELH